MFGRRVNRKPHTLIDAQTEVRGTVISRGTVEIRGRVTGDIQHDGTLLIAAGAICTSHIRATHLEIEGTVQGNVEIAGKLEIRKGGRLLGDSACASFVIHAGGVLNGQNRMHSAGAAEAAQSTGAPEARAPGPAAPEAQAASFAVHQGGQELKGLLDTLRKTPELQGTFQPRVTGG